MLSYFLIALSCKNGTRNVRHLRYSLACGHYGIDKQYLFSTAEFLNCLSRFPHDAT